jgi:type IV pilus assembly protein PilO
MEMKFGIDIANLSKTKKILLIALPSLAIIAFCISVFIMPAMEENSKLKADIAAHQKDIELLKKLSERLPTLISENEKLQKRLAELQMQLPEEKEVSELLKQVSLLGVKSGLYVITWKPKPRLIHPTKEVYEIPVEVEMRGDFHNFGQFFSSLTKLSRIVNLNEINIKAVADKRVQKGPTGLNVAFITNTYSIIPEQEKKEIQEKEAKEKEKAQQKK